MLFASYFGIVCLSVSTGNRLYKTEGAIFYSKPAHPKYDTDYAMLSEVYEEIIRRLIPETDTWTDTEWGDENNIHRAIVKHYGFDYRDVPNQYDLLIMMLAGVFGSSDRDELIWSAMNLHKLPSSLIATLWPNNTQETVEQLFIRAYEKTEAYEAAGRPNDSDLDEYLYATSVYSYGALKCSWLYQNVSAWFSENTCTPQNRTKIKQIIFSLSMLA